MGVGLKTLGLAPSFERQKRMKKKKGTLRETRLTKVVVEKCCLPFFLIISQRVGVREVGPLGVSTGHTRAPSSQHKGNSLPQRVKHWEQVASGSSKGRQQAAVLAWIGTVHCSLDTQSPLSLNLSIENNSEEEGPFAWLLIALILV